MNGRTELETLARLTESAYAEHYSFSLMSNLKTVTEDVWQVVPPGGGRSIAVIVEHLAWCKWMYEDYAFGSGTLKGNVYPAVPDAGVPARLRSELLEWLDAGHRRWLASVQALPGDDELDRPRLANWGALLPTRTLIEIVIGHDLYHAGEINHLRALLQGTDRWQHE
jgi:hypothetical protein